MMEHLQRPAQKLLEEFLQVRRKQIATELEKRWINSVGLDISNALRGKIDAIDMMLDMRNIFANMDKLEKELKDIDKKVEETSTENK